MGKSGKTPGAQEPEQPWKGKHKAPREDTLAVEDSSLGWEKALLEEGMLKLRPHRWKEIHSEEPGAGKAV